MKARNQAKHSNKSTLETTEISQSDETQLNHSYKHGGYKADAYAKSLDFSGETLSLFDSDIESLLYMIEEEKMAKEIYTELYEQTGLSEFEKVASSEGNHYDKLLSVADKFGVDTSSLSVEEGVFISSEIQTLYDTLLQEALLSTESAVSVAIAIEEADIADLEATVDITESVLLGQVYTNLADASLNHLNVFEGIA